MEEEEEVSKWVLTNTINNTIACATTDVRHSRAVADLLVLCRVMSCYIVLYRDARVSSLTDPRVQDIKRNWRALQVASQPADRGD